MNPYYADDHCTIWHGDARDVLPRIGGVAATVFSPPYNVAVDYDGHDDVMPWDAYADLAAAVCDGVVGAQPHGRTWVNVTPIVPTKPAAADGEPNPRTSLLALWDRALEASGHEPWDYVTWPTPGRGPGCSWGSWESPSGPNMRGEWEIIIAAHTGPSWSRSTPDEFRGVKDTHGDWMSLTTNVWPMRPETRGGRTGGHPAPFPSLLVSRCIRLSTWPGELVLDPFMGSGTTLRAAKDLGRRAVGIELSERYCEVAAKRLAQEVLPL